MYKDLSADDRARDIGAIAENNIVNTDWKNSHFIVSIAKELKIRRDFALVPLLIVMIAMAV